MGAVLRPCYSNWEIKFSKNGMIDKTEISFKGMLNKYQVIDWFNKKFPDRVVISTRGK